MNAIKRKLRFYLFPWIVNKEPRELELIHEDFRLTEASLKNFEAYIKK